MDRGAVRPHGVVDEAGAVRLEGHAVDGHRPVSPGPQGDSRRTAGRDRQEAPRPALGRRGRDGLLRAAVERHEEPAAAGGHRERHLRPGERPLLPPDLAPGRRRRAGERDEAEAVVPSVPRLRRGLRAVQPLASIPIPSWPYQPHGRAARTKPGPPSPNSSWRSARASPEMRSPVSGESPKCVIRARSPAPPASTSLETLEEPAQLVRRVLDRDVRPRDGTGVAGRSHRHRWPRGGWRVPDHARLGRRERHVVPPHERRPRFASEGPRGAGEVAGGDEAEPLGPGRQVGDERAERDEEHRRGRLREPLLLSHRPLRT